MSNNNSYVKQENQVVSNVDEFIIEAPEEDPSFDKLNNLVNVLENDIRKAHGNTIAIENVLVSIRKSAYESSHSHQAEHVSLLYCHISEEMKSQQQNNVPKLNYQEQDDDDNNSDTVSLTGEIPFFPVLWVFAADCGVGSVEQECILFPSLDCGLLFCGVCNHVVCALCGLEEH